MTKPWPSRGITETYDHLGSAIPPRTVLGLARQICWNSVVQNNSWLLKISSFLVMSSLISRSFNLTSLFYYFQLSVLVFDVFSFFFFSTTGSMVTYPHTYTVTHYHHHTVLYRWTNFYTALKLRFPTNRMNIWVKLYLLPPLQYETAVWFVISFLLINVRVKSAVLHNGWLGFL